MCLVPATLERGYGADGNYGPAVALGDHAAGCCLASVEGAVEVGVYGLFEEGGGYTVLDSVSKESTQRLTKLSPLRCFFNK